MKRNEQEVWGPILPTPKPGAPKRLEMSLESLSATAEWKKLSGTLKQIVSAYLGSGEKSMVDTLAAFQSRSMSPEKISEVAEKVLTTPSVVAVLKVYHGKTLEQNK